MSPTTKEPIPPPDPTPTMSEQLHNPTPTMAKPTAPIRSRPTRNARASEKSQAGHVPNWVKDIGLIGRTIKPMFNPRDKYIQEDIEAIQRNIKRTENGTNMEGTNEIVAEWKVKNQELKVKKQEEDDRLAEVARLLDQNLSIGPDEVDEATAAQLPQGYAECHVPDETYGSRPKRKRAATSTAMESSKRQKTSVQKNGKGKAPATSLKIKVNSKKSAQRSTTQPNTSSTSELSSPISYAAPTMPSTPAKTTSDQQKKLEKSVHPTFSHPETDADSPLSSTNSVDGHQFSDLPPDKDSFSPEVPPTKKITSIKLIHNHPGKETMNKSKGKSRVKSALQKVVPAQRKSGPHETSISLDQDGVNGNGDGPRRSGRPVKKPRAFDSQSEDNARDNEAVPQIPNIYDATADNEIFNGFSDDNDGEEEEETSSAELPTIRPSFTSRWAISAEADSQSSDHRIGASDTESEYGGRASGKAKFAKPSRRNAASTSISNDVTTTTSATKTKQVTKERANVVTESAERAPPSRSASVVSSRGEDIPHGISHRRRKVEELKARQEARRLANERAASEGS